MINWLTGQDFTKEAIDKLNKFSMAQVALSKELLGAKHLGICKITTSVDPKLNFRGLDLTYNVGKNTTRTVTILTSEELKVITQLRPKVHTRKHYVQFSRFNAAANTVVEKVISDSQAMASVDQVQEVVEGSSVSAIYIELWAIGTASDASTIVSFAKFVANDIGFTFAEMAAVGQVVNKNNILFFHQGLASNDGISNPIPVIRQWFKIPKSKQRMALGDRWLIQCACQGADTVDFCGFALYKEQF